MDYIPHPQNIARNNKRNNQRREDAAIHKDNSNQSPNPGVPSSQDSSTTERTRTQRINNARRNKGKMATEAQELIQRRGRNPQRKASLVPTSTLSLLDSLRPLPPWGLPLPISTDPHPLSVRAGYATPWGLPHPSRGRPRLPPN